MSSYQCCQDTEYIIKMKNSKKRSGRVNSCSKENEKRLVSEPIRKSEPACAQDGKETITPENDTDTSTGKSRQSNAETNMERVDISGIATDGVVDQCKGLNKEYSDMIANEEVKLNAKTQIQEDKYCDSSAKKTDQTSKNHAQPINYKQIVKHTDGSVADCLELLDKRYSDADLESENTQEDKDEDDDDDEPAHYDPLRKLNNYFIQPLVTHSLFFLET